MPDVKKKMKKKKTAWREAYIYLLASSFSIGNFQVAFRLCFKVRPSVKPF